MANTPAAIAALGVEGVKPYIRPVGLYNTKSKNLVALARQLLELHGGQVPAERAALEALPGVGRKTASIILNMVFGEAEIAVDTHIFRVANRTGLAPGRTPREVEEGCARQRRRSSARTRTTGSSCTGATYARPVRRSARSASSAICASTHTRRRRALGSSAHHQHRAARVGDHDAGHACGLDDRLGLDVLGKHGVTCAQASSVPAPPRGSSRGCAATSRRSR